ncbi:hypothetical protein FJTKL_07235 [Diaporthe vaccinii]|uniref:Uncharacterized protein n=1 Tax=Diaporthe vaccinii TaxID=105482 RepID=A0ABR4EU59_9PEZI
MPGPNAAANIIPKSTLCSRVGDERHALKIQKDASVPDTNPCRCALFNHACMPSMAIPIQPGVLDRPCSLMQ